MNRILVVCLATLAVVLTSASYVGLQPSVTASTPSFAGTWKGTMNNLPGIDLTIHEAGGKISGSVVFYFQKRAGINSPWHATADPAIPLLNPHVNGRLLKFEVEHHVCDGCQELGPNVTFGMELAGANEARLMRYAEDGTQAGPQMKLVRASQASNQLVPSLQAGISVEMPVTSNAAPMPDADQQDALILTVNRDGNLYLGNRRIDPRDLTPELRTILSSRKEKRLYIKADSRATYAGVLEAIDSVTAAGSETAVLLTSQYEQTTPGRLAPPAGFTVKTGESQQRPRARLAL